MIHIYNLLAIPRRLTIKLSRNRIRFFKKGTDVFGLNRTIKFDFEEENKIQFKKINSRIRLIYSNLKPKLNSTLRD